MIPGPVEVAPSVLGKMSEPLTAHYGDEWIEIIEDAISNTKQIMGTSGDVLIITGSGHSANDMVINSLFSPGDHVLVLDNGMWGGRLDEIARGHGLKVTRIEKPWGQPFRADDVRKAAAHHEDLKALLVVHGETSTGQANPVQEISAAAKEYDLLVMVDTIASLGGEPYKMDEWNIDVTTCAAQKGLEAPPGLGIIGLNTRAWAAVDSRTGPAGWMTDLKVWRHTIETMGSYHPHPGTMPVNTVNALRASTALILEEGLEARWERHARISQCVRDGARGMGLEVLAADEHASRNLTVILSDGAFDPNGLSDYLKEAYGMHIGLGLMALAGKAIRIGHMGPNANLEAMVPFLVGTESYLRKSGKDVPKGSSLAGIE